MSGDIGLMFGRVTRSLICIGGIMMMSPERGAAPDLASIGSDVGRAVVARTQTACAADPARCAQALTALGALQASTPRRSQDTLTAADRAIAARGRGG